MHTVKLYLKERSYSIIIGNNIMKLLPVYLKKLRLGNDAYIITNAAIKKRFGALLKKTLEQSGFSVRFKIVPDTEKSKSIEMSSKVIEDIARYDLGKRIFILAFGGGVIGDLSGFIASVYRRGIPYIQIPTTLLAQVDSSIGGKTGVDLSKGKNLVGAFYQPRLVFSDVRFLATLEQRQVRAGLAEVIKYGIIRDPKLFSFLEGKFQDALAGKLSVLEYIVKRCSSIKAGIVQSDEREEKGIRTILNFGHTAGHAIEAAGNYKRYGHGEAIALGMLVATGISQRLNLIQKKISRRIEGLIKKVGLPTSIKRTPLEAIINAHYRDKKFIGTKNRFVLINGIGRTKIVENIPLEIIKTEIRKRFTAI